MVTTPVTFGIYSYYDKSKDKTLSFYIPYILSFEINKDSDNLTVRGKVRLPKNIYYDIPKPVSPPSNEKDLLTGNKSNSPYFYEIPDELKLPFGLQVLNQDVNTNLGVSTTGDAKKPLEWVTLEDLPDNGGGPKASKDLLEISINGDVSGTNDSVYIGKAFTYDTAFDFTKATSLTIDSKPLELNFPKATKFAKNYNLDNTSRKYSVGDLFTIRHGFLSNSINFENKNYAVKDNLITDTFYITKVVPTEKEIELHLENWAWKLRQIPCKGSFNEDIKLIDFLKNFVFPVMLKETYLNAIITRDGEEKPPTIQPRVDFSKLTDDLLINKINKGFYLPITNFYDILVTLKEKFLLTFNNLEYLSTSCVSCSIGYGYRDASESSYYDTQQNIIKKNVNFISYDDYKILIRITSNKALTKEKLKQLKAEVSKSTDPTTERYNILKKQKEIKAQVVFGDRGVLGMIRSNNSKLGQQSLQTEGNQDSVNLVNIQKIWVEGENLEKFARTLYNRMKFGTALNTIVIKGPSPTLVYGNIYDIIKITDRQDPKITGNYIITQVNTSMDVENGYNKNISLGVRIPNMTDFMENIK